MVTLTMAFNSEINQSTHAKDNATQLSKPKLVLHLVYPSRGEILRNHLIRTIKIRNREPANGLTDRTVQRSKHRN